MRKEDLTKQLSRLGVSELAPIEMKPGRRYLLRVNQHVPMDSLESMGKAFSVRGFDVTVVSGDFDLFEMT
jgi:hypothetical protein